MKKDGAVGTAHAGLSVLVWFGVVAATMRSEVPGPFSGASYGRTAHV
ncbi:hypothetical protein [Streptomyces sp. NPDC048295]